MPVALARNLSGRKNSKYSETSAPGYFLGHDPGRERREQDAVPVMRGRGQQIFITPYLAQHGQPIRRKWPEARPFLADLEAIQARCESDGRLSQKIYTAAGRFLIEPGIFDGCASQHPAVGARDQISSRAIDHPLKQPFSRLESYHLAFDRLDLYGNRTRPQLDERSPRAGCKHYCSG